MKLELILIILIVVITILFISILFLLQKKKFTKFTEITDKNVDELADYVRALKQEQEEKASLAMLKKSEQKNKLEYFRQTREELKTRLKSKFQMKEWQPLSRMLNSADKGTVGIYVLYNKTKNKYYVGQAKALVSRIKKHFEVEEIAKDYYIGLDEILVKTLTATELGDDYRVDHIEKVGIEIYDANKSGYNKTVGNL